MDQVRGNIDLVDQVRGNAHRSFTILCGSSVESCPDFMLVREKDPCVVCGDLIGRGSTPWNFAQIMHVHEKDPCLVCSDLIFRGSTAWKRPQIVQILWINSVETCTNDADL